jgi:hypothetical protein
VNLQQLRTVRLGIVEEKGKDQPADHQEVLIAAVGVLRRVSPGRSVGETLEAAGIMRPMEYQTMRVNNEVVKDFGQKLKPGDKLTIVNRVVGG